MSMTLAQIKEDVASGKCKRIYFSSGSLWWTHSDDDVLEATRIGDVEFEKRNRAALDNHDMPEETKKKLRALMNARIDQKKAMKKKVKESLGIPMDIIGAPLMQSDDPSEWLAKAEQQKDHFGPHGMNALIKTHHQNCNGIAYMGWNEVTASLNLRII